MTECQIFTQSDNTILKHIGNIKLSGLFEKNNIFKTFSPQKELTYYTWFT